MAHWLEEDSVIITKKDERTIPFCNLSDPEEELVVVKDGRLRRGRIKEKSMNILKRFFS